MTYYNLKTWFDSWQEELIELGFANLDDENKVVIPLDKLERILNVDLIERQMGNIIKDMSREKRDELKRKLEDADNSPNNSDIMPMSPLTEVLESQDNMEESKGEEDNTIHEAAM